VKRGNVRGTMRKEQREKSNVKKRHKERQCEEQCKKIVNFFLKFKKLDSNKCNIKQEQQEANTNEHH
jgi:hypothetical protein